MKQGYIRHTDTEVYFCNGEGVLFRFSNEGVCGWRLQSADADGAFCDVGASQSLALYMGEEMNERRGRLRVEVLDGAIRACADDGTCAVLSQTPAFGLTFCAPDGKTVCEVTSLSHAAGKAEVCGRLLAGE